MEPFIKIEKLEKIYSNGAKAVHDFNLDINKNEFIVLVGPSGCGKTTTLRMIAGLEEITHGNLFINGEYVNYKPSKDRQLAIVFQSYALYAQMSVFENIAFPLTVNKFMFPVVNIELNAIRQLLGIFNTIDVDKIKEVIEESKSGKRHHVDPMTFVSKKLNVSQTSAKKILSYDIASEKNSIKDIIIKLEEEEKNILEKIKEEEKKVNDKSEYLDNDGNVVFESRKMLKHEIEDKVFKVAETLNLGDYLNRLPKQLSGGQMQRVALGRAIVKDVPLFLMDEPLSNLDAQLRSTMRGEIVKLHRRLGSTTIYVTHDQTEAMTMADRIVVMSKGFIQQIDTPEEIYNNPCNLFVAKFMGTPAINLLQGKIGNKAINIGNEIQVTLNEDQIIRIEQFYQQAHEEFSKQLENYDGSSESKAFIKKILSALDDKKGMLTSVLKPSRLVRLVEKIQNFRKKEEVIEVDYERQALEEKTNSLYDYIATNGSLIIGIRPENVHIDLLKDSFKKENQYIIEPTLIELLGSEFHVHIDFGNHDIVAKIPAKEKVRYDTKFALTIAREDICIFDPVTGRRIL